MLINAKRENALTMNSTVSDHQKEDIPTDYCSSFYSKNYQNLIQSQQLNHLSKDDRFNKREAQMLLERLNSLRIVQSSMTQKF